jgi:hypothetical protein
MLNSKRTIHCCGFLLALGLIATAITLLAFPWKRDDGPWKHQLRFNVSLGEAKRLVGAQQDPVGIEKRLLPIMADHVFRSTSGLALGEIAMAPETSNETSAGTRAYSLSRVFLLLNLNDENDLGYFRMWCRGFVAELNMERKIPVPVTLELLEISGYPCRSRGSISNFDILEWKMTHRLNLETKFGSVITWDAWNATAPDQVLNKTMATIGPGYVHVI